MLRALIVDDEPIARRVLREELDSLQTVDVIGEADNGYAALEKIQNSRPDIVFLDIEMPGMGGFELLSNLNGGFLPAIVMVTAYDEHAIRAFEAGAIDVSSKTRKPDTPSAVAGTGPEAGERSAACG